AGDGELPAVRVAGQRQIDAVRARLGEQIGIVREQHRRYARWPLGEGARDVVAIGPGVVDAGDEQAGTVVLDDDAAVAQHDEPGVRQLIDELLAVGEVVVVAHAREYSVTRAQS